MELTRRFFLKSSGALAAYLGVAPGAAWARALSGPIAPARVTPNRTLVVIFLRGGADGLNLVVPHGDPSYQVLRQSIAISAPAPGGGDRAIDLDGHFGLHPRLSALKPLFDEHLALAVHAVGYDKNTRSHFEEQDVWETGIIGNTVASDGWLNRHLATSEGHGSIRAVSIGNSLPRILQGRAPAYAIRGVSDLTLPSAHADRATVVAALEHAYRLRPEAVRDDAVGLVHEAGSTTLEGVQQLSALADRPYQPAANYPETEFARKLMQVAQLIKADVGLEVAEVDLDGWDTHASQGGANGQFANLARTLGEGVAAFTRDLEGRLDDVLVVTLTDFGRTAAENGTQGTDHGWANCMFLAGGPVRNGHRAARESGSPRLVAGKWPGLAPDQLHEGRDLLHTTDFRNVLAELVRVHLGNDNLERLLPSHRFERVGLIA